MAVQTVMNTKHIILLSAVVVVGVVSASIKLFNTTTDTNPQMPNIGTVPEFSLLTQDSVEFTNNDLSGQITIADFIFTSCSGPCPLMSSKMEELQEQLPEAKIKLLSFSVDPEYDTPSILKEYGHKFNAKQDKWIFLTGERKAIYSLARYGFKLTVEDEEYAILHSTKFILIDDKAIIRGYYDYEDSTAMLRLINETRNLLSLVNGR
ncbi:MAG: SCO family protein [Ignavibacteriae bacterium]|nr:SCO family protein [Ignavibacteriota bacterium]